MAVDSPAIEKAIGRALAFLDRQQLPSGELQSYRSTDPAMDRSCEPDSSPFPTALIAFSLGFSGSPQAKQVLSRATAFLRCEMERGSVWRYWASTHPYHKVIPPDLDDTACISQVLERDHVAFPDNRRLILANRNRQGLFYTWISPRFSFTLDPGYWSVVLREALRPVRLHFFWKLNESKANDIDCVVNANVLAYLGESDETRAVIGYLIRTVRDGQEECCDKWHLSRFNLYYAISRNYFAGIRAFAAVRDVVIARVRTFIRDDGTIGSNVLETAMAVCSLINWGCDLSDLQDGIHAILGQQQAGGEWQKFPLYFGGPKRYYGWGSEELTTGFCVEALSRYLERTARP